MLTLAQSPSESRWAPRYGPWSLQQVHALPNAPRFGPVITPRCHGDDAVIGGVVGTQRGQQDMHRTACPTSRHGVVDHDLQSPLKLFHYGAFAVVVLTGEKSGRPWIWLPGHIAANPWVQTWWFVIVGSALGGAACNSSQQAKPSWWHCLFDVCAGQPEMPAAWMCQSGCQPGPPTLAWAGAMMMMMMMRS